MHIVFINEYYYVKIYDSNKKICFRLYQLYGLGNNLICESYDRDLFLLKCNKYVKLSNNIECLIASYKKSYILELNDIYYLTQIKNSIEFMLNNF